MEINQKLSIMRHIIEYIDLLRPHMTFKHVKFEDSVVMRSLEKLAQQKGLVKPEEITKTASSKVDLSPSTVLMENVLHLCAGLRQSGFSKYADELEEKFVSFKQAQTLYEAHSEKGEDLVDRAHPKGSHKLEDVEGGELAVFETIVDQHLKALDMIEKTPTGKLASSRDVLNAVKIVLAQVDPEATKQGKAAMVLALNLVSKGLTSFTNVFYGQLLTDTKPNLDDAAKQIAELVGKIQAVPDDGQFPNQLMTDIGNQIFAARKWVDETRKHYSSDSKEKVDDQAWWRKFNYAASLVGQGQSMSWGATKAINDGDLSGLKFHASHLSADEVSNVITINIVRPLQSLRSQVDSMQFWERRNKLSPDLQAKANAAVDQLDPAIKSAQGAVSGISGAIDPNLRVIHPGKIAALFADPLDDTFKVNTLDELKAKAAQVVGIYNKNLATIKSWIEKAEKTAGA
jgi:hypothetical protein